METLPKNVLFDMALKLSLKDLAKFCILSKRFDEVVCKSNDFWRIKLKQDFNLETKEKNTKKIYEKILENKDYCNNLLLEGTVNPDDFVINSFDEIFEGDDYLVFLFLRSKILFENKLQYPNLHKSIFDKHIKKINYKYGNKITNLDEFSSEEIETFINILKKNAGNSFQKDIINRMINNDISLLIKWKDLCENSSIY